MIIWETVPLTLSNGEKETNSQWAVPITLMRFALFVWHRVAEQQAFHSFVRSVSSWPHDLSGTKRLCCMLANADG